MDGRFRSKSANTAFWRGSRPHCRPRTSLTTSHRRWLGIIFEREGGEETEGEAVSPKVEVRVRRLVHSRLSRAALGGCAPRTSGFTTAVSSFALDPFDKTLRSGPDISGVGFV